LSFVEDFGIKRLNRLFETSLEKLLASSALEAKYENMKQDMEEFQTGQALQRLGKIARKLGIEIAEDEA